jgi:hypothetical protein
MQEFFRDNHPTVAVIAADWPKYFRRGFDLIIEDLKRPVAQAEASGARVIILRAGSEVKAAPPATELSR